VHTVYLSLGSNIGDRQENLNAAIQKLGENSAIIIEKVSQFYETSPVGDVPQDDFINAAAQIATTLSPEELLDYIHVVEAELGRERLIHWGPRTIDIDILFFDDLTQEDEKLTIPHKEVFNRLFVLQPLSELVDWENVQNAISDLAQTEQKVVPVAKNLPANKRLETAVTEILKAVGENPEREGLL